MDRHPSATARSRLTAAADRLATALSGRVAIDLRALAVFRIGLGVLLVGDLLARSRSLTAFYTDDGVLPREAFFADYSTLRSIHAFVGEPWAIALLFAVAAGFAFALAVGYRTRLVTVVSWLLLLSLHTRNPMVLNAGDNLLLMLLFWSAFLPLGARWSVDAVRRADESAGSGSDSGSATAGDTDSASRSPSGPAVATVATMAVLVQVLAMYATNAVHKYESELWMNGDAIAYIMQADQFTYLLGNHLAEFHGLLRAFSLLWIGLLFASPLLLLLRGLPRAAVASLFVGMHLGMAATIRIGLFPLVVVVAFIPFYQTPVWDLAERGIARLDRSGNRTRWHARFVSAARRFLVVTGAFPRPAVDARGLRSRVETLSAGVARGRVLVTTVVPYVFLVLIVLSSAQAVGYADTPDPGEEVLEAVEMDQSWRMFAPDPLHTTRWYVVPGTLEDGSEWDVFRDAAVDYERPAQVETTYPSARWRKYLSNVYGADNEKHRSYFANYLCDDWNRTHDTSVEQLTVTQSYERTIPGNETVEAANEFDLITYDCSGPLVQND